MSKLDGFDGVTAWMDRTFIAQKDVLPITKGELLKLPPRHAAMYLRQLIQTSDVLMRVFRVAAAELASHVITIEGKEQKRLTRLFNECDNGDGIETLITRLFIDSVACGWHVCGIEWSGVKVKDIYHIDATKVRMNVGKKSKPRDRWPLIYDGPTGEVYVEKAQLGGQAMWYIPFPAPKSEVLGRDGWIPAYLPLISVYNIIRLIIIAELVATARESGEVPNKLVYLNLPRGTTQSAIKSAYDRAKAEEDGDTASAAITAKNAILIEGVSDAELRSVEVNIREPISVEDLERRNKAAVIRLCSIVGVDPMAVDPSLSGSGGLNEGTKALASDDKRDGRYVAQWVKVFERQLNFYCVPSGTHVRFGFKDPRDREREVKNKGALIQAYAVAISVGMMSAEEARRDAGYEGIFNEGVLDEAPPELDNEEEIDVIESEVGDVPENDTPEVSGLTGGDDNIEVIIE